MTDKDPFFYELLNRIFGKDHINKQVLDNLIKKFNLTVTPETVNAYSSTIHLWNHIPSELKIHNGLPPEQRLKYYIRGYIINTFLSDSKIRIISLSTNLSLDYDIEQEIIKKLFPSLANSEYNYLSLNNIIEHLSGVICGDILNVNYYEPYSDILLHKLNVKLIQYIFKDYADTKYLFR